MRWHQNFWGYKLISVLHGTSSNPSSLQKTKFILLSCSARDLHNPDPILDCFTNIAVGSILWYRARCALCKHFLSSRSNLTFLTILVKSTLVFARWMSYGSCSWRMNNLLQKCPVLFCVFWTEIHCTLLVWDVIDESLSHAVMVQLWDTRSLRSFLASWSPSRLNS